MSTAVLRVLLLVSFSVRCWCVPTVSVSVRRGQNVSLPCHSNHSDSSAVMAWYRLSSEKMTLLVSAARGNLKNKNVFIVGHNEERSRFGLQADSGPDALSLVISALREEDLGLYFCAAGVRVGKMLFGTAVRLVFADAERRRSSEDVGGWSLWLCVCIACGICGFLCACLLYYRKDSSVFSCINCVKQNSNVQAAQVQYSSLRFIRRSRAAAPAPQNVTYATIAKHTP